MAKPKSKKAKKGKKGSGSKTKKPAHDRDQELASALANSKIWATRVDIIQNSRNEYRNACKALAITNQDLTDELQGSARNSIDVLQFLKQEDLRKDATISQLESKLRDFDNTMKKEKEKIVESYEDQLRSLKTGNNLKEQEIQLLQKELLKVKEFRHNKAVMQEEIETFKRQLHKTTLNHETSVANMERRFFDEKIKLEKEAGSRINELAERAHSEAVKQLDMTTRQVYQDNVRLTDALSKHISESDNLRTENENLQEISRKLKNEIETNDQTIKRKVLESKMLKEKTGVLKDDVKCLEDKLEKQLVLADSEKIKAITDVSNSNEKLQQEVHSLTRSLQLQSHEMRKLKRAANRVLKDRSNVEAFLISSLNYTRKEIKTSREQYIKACEQSYQQQMLEAHKGNAPYPKVTTFKKQLPRDKSTKSVYDGLIEAENANLDNQGPIDIGEMTWEQRENILRLLFAQINGSKTQNSSSSVKKIGSSSAILAHEQVGKSKPRVKSGVLPPIRGLTPPEQANSQKADKGNGVTTFLTEIEQ